MQKGRCLRSDRPEILVWEVAGVGVDRLSQDLALRRIGCGQRSLDGLDQLVHAGELALMDRVGHRYLLVLLQFRTGPPGRPGSTRSRDRSSSAFAARMSGAMSSLPSSSIHAVWPRVGGPAWLVRL